MDFSKAFDTVDHNKLIYKLSALGIHPLTTRWIKSFLQGRTQQVRIDGCTSDTLPVVSGVPQGSVLGPCLFLAYINDLPDSVKSKVRLFVDDTIMLQRTAGGELAGMSGVGRRFCQQSPASGPLLSKPIM